MSGGIERLVGSIKDFQSARHTSGNIICNSTTWANLDNTLDLVLVASAGDMIEVDMSGLWNNEGVDGYLDVVTIVAGSPVSYLGGDGAVGSQGIEAWRGGAAVYGSVGGGVVKALVAGDIVNGTVTLRLRYRTNTASNKTLITGTDLPLVWWAKNLGQVGGWAAIAFGAPAWGAYIPTLTTATTSPTLGTGSSVRGSYTQMGTLIFGNAGINFGSSGVVAGSGNYRLSLPVPAKVSATDNVMCGSGIAYDASTGTVATLVVAIPVASSGLYAQMYITGTGVLIDHDAPWIWAASDQIAVDFTYEAA